MVGASATIGYDADRRTAPPRQCPPRLLPDIQAQITGLNTRLTTLDDDLATTRRARPVWQERAELRRSVPGMGPVCARTRLLDAQSPQGRSPGSLAWSWLANTFFWIDPTKRVTDVFMTQQLPFFDHKAIALFRAYEAAVYEAL
jgi:CubicO group peptidase (beta-lactamase class C family)